MLVSSPDRYCVHEMVVSQRRAPQSADKARKDVQQAALLLEAAQETKVLADFGHAWLEAWDIGPKTRRPLVRAEDLLSQAAAVALARARAEAAEDVGREAGALEGEIAAARVPRPAASHGSGR